MPLITAGIHPQLGIRLCFNHFDYLNSLCICCNYDVNTVISLTTGDLQHRNSAACWRSHSWLLNCGRRHGSQSSSSDHPPLSPQGWGHKHGPTSGLCSTENIIQFWWKLASSLPTKIYPQFILLLLLFVCFWSGPLITQAGLENVM